MSSSMVSHSLKKEIPGDLALWFFLMAELAAFGVMVLGFAFVRLTEPDMFLEGLNKLHLTSGIINTLALLSGSYLAALGVHQVRSEERRVGKEGRVGWMVCH